MTNLDLEQYGRSLMERIDTAQILKRIQVSEDEWTPDPNDCHRNVAEWCEFHPEYSPVRGWLYFQMDDFPNAGFLPHSVVRSPEGKILDITPSYAPEDYPFIEACLSEEEFADLVDHIHENNWTLWKVRKLGK